MNKLMIRIVESISKVMGRALEARRRKDGRPFVVGHFVTNRCMCKCASCLWRHNDWEDVPLDELKRFYREARDEGFVAAALSGGEPFLRRDLGEFVRFLKEDLDFKILLFTTGWFLKKRMDEVLPYVDMLMVSLDAADGARHDQIRGLPGLFHRATEGVRLAKERYPHLSMQFNCCVQKGIEDDIDSLIELTESMQMRISFDVITEFRHGEEDGRFVETQEGLPFEDLQRVCETLLQRKSMGSPIVNSEYYFNYFAQGRRGYRCHLPKILMFVDGRGNVEDCLNLDRPIANIRDMPLKAIMEQPRFKELRPDAEKCWSCNSPTMVDLSHAWENPKALLKRQGIMVG